MPSKSEIMTHLDIGESHSNHDFLVYMKPFGIKQFIPQRFPPHLERQVLESFLNQLESNKQIGWAFTTLEDYEPRISMKLINLGPNLLNTIRPLAPIIRNYDLSELDLKILPTDLLNPIDLNLVSLNLDGNQLDMDVFRQFNSIMALHRRQQQQIGTKNHINQISWVRNILELHLNRNCLDDTFPEQNLGCLTKLKRLYVKQNTISSLRGLGNLTDLRILMMDYNRIAMIHPDFFNLKKLEYAYFAHNRINQPLTGSGIRNLNHLRVIDLSHNDLITLPGSLFSLPKLEHLNASNNSLSFLPNVQKSSRIKSNPIYQINLSNNQLTTVPEGLARISKQLDISYNKIRSVHVGLFKWIIETCRSKKIKPAELVDLDLNENPLIWPPPSIATQGMNAMVEFYYESKIEAQSYYGLKVLFLGSTDSGKSSLCLSMLDHQPRYTDRQDELTYGLDIFNIPVDIPIWDSTETGANSSSSFNKPTTSVENPNDSLESVPVSNLPEEKSTNLRIWDCSSNRAYLNLISYFVYMPNVIAVMVDLSKYPTKANDHARYNYFCSTVGIWLDLVLARTNQVILVLVGTKIDLIPNPGLVKQRLDQLHRDATNYLKEHSMWLVEQSKQIESLHQISSAATFYYDHLRNLQDSLYISLYTVPVWCTCSPDVSKVAIETWDQLCQSFFRLASHIPDIYPYVLGSLPQMWSDIEAYVEQLIEDRIYMGLLSRTQFHQLVQKKFHLTDNEVILSLNYLHNIGRVHITDFVWSKEEHDHMNQNSDNSVRPLPCPLVVFDLRLVLETLKYLIHPNLYKILDNQNSKSTDPRIPTSFFKTLLRWFKSATTSGALGRLNQAQQELARGTGVVSSYLWIALVEMASFEVSGEAHLNTGRLYVEFLWRWLEIAYPVGESDLLDKINQKTCEGDEKQEQAVDQAQLVNFPYNPTPAELANATGILVNIFSSSNNSDENLDPDDTPEPPNIPTWTGSDLVRSVISVHGLPALRFPCLILQEKPPSGEEDPNQIVWDMASRDGPEPIMPVYRFPKGLPSGFFDRVSVRLNWPEQFEFKYTAHWKTGVQMWNEPNGILLRLIVTESTDGDPIVRFEFRALPVKILDQQQDQEPAQLESTSTIINSHIESNLIVTKQQDMELTSGSDQIAQPQMRSKSRKKLKIKWHKWPLPEENLWNLILPVLKEFDSVLLAYRGLCYRRVMQCPNCNELTLSGEWLQPQEAQTVRHRKCAACGHKVASCLVAPPEHGSQYIAKLRKKSKKKRQSRKHASSK